MEINKIPEYDSGLDPDLGIFIGVQTFTVMCENDCSSVQAFREFKPSDLSARVEKYDIIVHVNKLLVCKNKKKGYIRD